MGKESVTNPTVHRKMYSLPPSHTLNGREITGLDASTASLIGPFRNIMAFFTYVQSALSSAYELEENVLEMEILHLRFSRWGAGARLTGEVTHLREIHAAVRCVEDIPAAKVILAQIASRLEEAAKITKDRNT